MSYVRNTKYSWGKSIISAFNFGMNNEHPVYILSNVNVKFCLYATYLFIP